PSTASISQILAMNDSTSGYSMPSVSGMQFDQSSESGNAADASNVLEQAIEESGAGFQFGGTSNNHLWNRLAELRKQLEDLAEQRRQKEVEISGIENIALRMRFEGTINE